MRAGLVEDCKVYRFCGHAAALVDPATIRRGLMSFLKHQDWSKAAAEYRMLVFVIGGSANRSNKRVLDQATLACGGRVGVGPTAAPTHA